ncbi:ankyrin repeat and SOCS box protein 13-like [Schistocerca cancellata]|uniref:ankyrin repeat and SOCS box protein 13-like n=1 Tax=Schistocerca cancellata TaxID=274614 RepID=UPI002118F1D5|nr:ankyrin repeat and SOCS box protein 13-like [Schistocerca cancellata]
MLRICPTVPVISRVASEDLRLPRGRVLVPKGTVLLLVPGITQRLPQFYPHPLRFDPSRFLDGRRGEEHACSYLPFGVGARSCVGTQYARLQLKVFLAEILRHFRFLPHSRWEDLEDASVAMLIWRKQVDTPERLTNIGSPALEELENTTGSDKAGNSPLHYAAVRGSAEGVRLLSTAGADALLEDSQCVTPLVSTVMLGNAECVRLLACAVRNLESTDLQGFTAMHDAALNGDGESLKHLLRAGARSSPVTSSLNTPLHQATVAGNAECVRVLLQVGANVATRDADGFTALHFAVLGGNPDCLRHLLAVGADVRAQEASGFTPLHIAAAAGAQDAVRS